jgi:hypothetical protein
MSANRDRLVAALDELNDAELDALIAVVDDCPQIAPLLLAWLQGAIERPLPSAELERLKLAGPCRWHSAIADVPAHACSREQRQAGVDPM